MSIVTGCSSGVGKDLAIAINKAGHTIVATARKPETLSYLPDEPNVLKLALDVTSKDAILQTLSTATQKFGHIDVVINNAGYALMGDTEAIAESDARLQMETCFWGPVVITQEAVRIFREINPAGKGGTVVQISSIGGYVTFPGSSFYHARLVKDPSTQNSKKKQLTKGGAKKKANSPLEDLPSPSPKKWIQIGILSS